MVFACLLLRVLDTNTLFVRNWGTRARLFSMAVVKIIVIVVATNVFQVHVLNFFVFWRVRHSSSEYMVVCICSCGYYYSCNCI